MPCLELHVRKKKNQKDLNEINGELKELDRKTIKDKLKSIKRGRTSIIVNGNG